MTKPNDPAAPLPPADDEADERGPYSAASDACMAVLLALHAQPIGLSLAGLMEVTGLPVATLSHALQGLKNRGRVASHGRGYGCTWRTVHHIRRQLQAEERNEQAARS